MSEARTPYAIATQSVGVANRSNRGTVVATGTEVIPLLQGVVTSDVFALAEEGAGQLSTAVNAKGRLVCDLRLLHVDEMLLMDFEPGMVEDGVVSHFRANVMMEDAKFTDRTAHTGRVCVVGPLAAERLQAAGKLARPLDRLAQYHGTWGEVAGVEAIVQRIPTYGVPAYDLYVPSDALDRVVSGLDAPAVDEALETLRIEAGIPRWGAELDEKIIPLEAGLDPAISYDKGCYVGQEIIARLDTLGTPARLLRKLVAADAETLPVGAEVSDGTRSVGDVRSAAYSPAHERGIALAYVKRDFNDIGRKLIVDKVEVIVRPLAP